MLQHLLTSPTTSAPTISMVVEPFLHYSSDRIYNGVEAGPVDQCDGAGDALQPGLSRRARHRDLQESLNEILAGPKMALYKRWVYGLEEAPDDFICRKCIYALTE